MSEFTEHDYVGAGRSASVFRGKSADGEDLACKVFTSDTLSKIIFFILTGSANPYTWCSHAMSCAVSRRIILSELVDYWFNGALRLPKTHGWEWNASFNAFQLNAELINGTHAPLLSPLSAEPIDYFDNLHNGIMRPLQEYLKASGFDGQVWQAGFGNPVAANNFMLEQSSSDLPSWVWIDLESGVPALFSLNPIRTLTYYLPKSWFHRRWIFDDIDTDQLKTYLSAHQEQLTRHLGDDRYGLIVDEVDRLKSEQDEWRAIGRNARSIKYALSQQKITEQQADYYYKHPISWQFVLIKNLSLKLFDKLSRLPKKIATWLGELEIARYFKRAVNYVKSSRFRWGVARWFVARRIKAWSERGYLNNNEAFQLRKMLHHDDSSAYLTDFSVHIAIKPTADVIAWGILPLLWLYGSLPQMLLPILIVMIGPILRVSYTGARIVQEIARRQKPQWVALFIGAFPVIGNLAYPTQLLYRGAENSGELARFIIYDISSSIGRKIPIWGGADTQTEHWFNQLSDKLVRNLNHALERKAKLKDAQKSWRRKK